MQIQGRASMPRAELGFGTAVWDEREHTGSALGAGTRICQKQGSAPCAVAHAMWVSVPRARGVRQGCG